ncbi:hypothetical protein ACIP6P_12925 [Streptomyces sp. NPDC088729]|uniref:hypothetical protein n=1 Tax=unclassified Streptomyces TaxID=2593676 RepID=UPI0013DDF5DA|nr:hypothetical protein [Streptomyces sp. ADI96-02]
MMIAAFRAGAAGGHAPAPHPHPLRGTGVCAAALRLIAAFDVLDEPHRVLVR